MIDPVRSDRGFPRAKTICDDCGRSECFPASHQRKRGNTEAVNEGQVIRKAEAQGWAVVKGKLRCPTCEAKRKVVPMKPQEVVKPRAPETGVPEMSKRQKIEIFTMLAEVYDIDAGCFRNGDTDDSVADVLGVRPGWVSQVREAEFGPSGSNGEIEALVLTVESLSKEQNRLRSEICEVVDCLEGKYKAVDVCQSNTMAALDALNKIKSALGSRVLKKAGIQ